MIDFLLNLFGHGATAEYPPMLAKVIVGFVVLVGSEIALAILAVIAWDLYALATGRKTVSGECLRLALHRPAFAVIVSGLAGFIVGCLVGHLFLYQTPQ